MKIDELTNPVVCTVLGAVERGDLAGFLAAFEPNAILTDDGRTQPLARWADQEIFSAHGQMDVDAEDDGGLRLSGRYQSDQWEMGVTWRFEIADGKVRRLDVGAL